MFLLSAKSLRFCKQTNFQMSDALFILRHSTCPSVIANLWQTLGETKLKRSDKNYKTITFVFQIQDRSFACALKGLRHCYRLFCECFK